MRYLGMLEDCSLLPDFIGGEVEMNEGSKTLR